MPNPVFGTYVGLELATNLFYELFDGNGTIFF